ncbi:MAG TPA: hypothetical protein VGI64_11030 [Streptosporangiaceae bacterium]
MVLAGANAEAFDLMRQTPAEIGPASRTLRPTGQRVYLNNASKTPGHIPASWPAPSDPAARVCVSIRPEPAAVVSRSLDEALKAWLSQAPQTGPPSLLALWHEASTMKYPIRPDQLRAAQKHIQALVSQNGYNVKVGAIERATISASSSSIWMARNLDFYGCDSYDDQSCGTNPVGQLDEFKRLCDALADAGEAIIGITETNTRCELRRPFWFGAAWRWLKSRQLDTVAGTCFLTCWNPPPAGFESGPWLGGDWATIDALDAILSEAAALLQARA